MKNLGKLALVSTLALTIVTTCSAAPMAMGLTSGTSAKTYANSIEALGEGASDAYELNAETYPIYAQNNANAPSQFLSNVKNITGGLFSGIK